MTKRGAVAETSRSRRSNATTRERKAGPRRALLRAPAGRTPRDATHLPSPVVITTDAVERAALEIGALGRQATLKLHYEVGRIISSTLLGEGTGSPGEPKLGPPLRSLASRLTADGFPINYATLSRSLALYRLLLPMGGVATWQHIGASHIRAVLPLQEPRRTELLKQAEQERLSVRQLETRAARQSEKNSTVSSVRRGRPPSPRCLLQLGRIERLLFDDESLRCVGDGDAQQPQVRIDMLEVLGRLRKRVEDLEKMLR
ncbi:MAG: hypothetical protein HMLKMBBP_01258 [Planctomycetes bacterium]|nr:hypothetical protein [Planctomycetota bacterium]